MTGEPGWNIDGVTRGVLRHVESLGYVVSLHRLAASLLGTIGPSVELHAVKLGEPAEVYVVKVRDGDEDDVYASACELARMVGVELEE